jgi:hypothetical protein
VLYYHKQQAQGGALAIRRAIQHHLLMGSQLLPQHVWLLEQPCPSARKEAWHAVCSAALTAMFRYGGLMFSMLARSPLIHVAVEARAVNLLHAALTDFAARQGSVSVLSDSSQALPFVCARPNSFLTVSL